VEIGLWNLEILKGMRGFDAVCAAFTAVDLIIASGKALHMQKKDFIISSFCEIFGSHLVKQKALFSGISFEIETKGGHQESKT
jgi:hypothetical protein